MKRRNGKKERVECIAKGSHLRLLEITRPGGAIVFMVEKLGYDSLGNEVWYRDHLVSLEEAHFQDTQYWVYQQFAELAKKVKALR